MGFANYCVTFLAYSLKGAFLHLGHPLVGSLYFIEPHASGFLLEKRIQSLFGFLHTGTDRGSDTCSNGCIDPKGFKRLQQYLRHSFFFDQSAVFFPLKFAAPSDFASPYQLRPCVIFWWLFQIKV